MSGCAGTSLLLGLFSSCGKQELLSSCNARVLIEAASHCRAQVLDTRASVTGACGLCSCGSPALENRLNSCGERT